MLKILLHLFVISTAVGLALGCGGSYVGSGNITSQNYPHQYPENSRCTWTLTATADHDILLRLINLDTEAGYDFINVYKGIVEENSFPSNYLHRYTGQRNESSYYNESSETIVVGPTATVMFFSDNSVKASGFQIEFLSVNIPQNNGCGDRVFGSGNITSPNYPNQYPMNSRCTWTLSAIPGTFISLKMIRFDTESLFDYLYVFNGTKTSNSSLSDYLIRYSGRYYNGNYNYSSKPVVTGPNATIIFISDSSVSASGFQIEYTNIDVSPYTDCGGTRVGSGNITSPKYPNLYPLNSRCTWWLRSAYNTGLDIYMRIISLDTESSYDSVEVFSSEAGIFRQYSGRDYCRSKRYDCSLEPMTVGPDVRITFISDSTVSASGFHIEFFDGLSFKGCGGSLFGAGNITSPNYPNRYEWHTVCTWTLTANPGTYISLRIVSMDLGSDLDNVYVFNGSRTSNTSPVNYSYRFSGGTRDNCGRYNCSSKSMLIGPMATIIFASRYSGLGFQIEYASVDVTPFTGEGESTTSAAATAAVTNTTAAIATTKDSDSLAAITTASGTGATSVPPPVTTLRRCKLRRNTTTSALPNA